jgi:hypothetical protein
MLQPAGKSPVGGPGLRFPGFESKVNGVTEEETLPLQKRPVAGRCYPGD